MNKVSLIFAIIGVAAASVGIYCNVQGSKIIKDLEHAKAERDKKHNEIKGL